MNIEQVAARVQRRREIEEMKTELEHRKQCQLDYAFEKLHKGLNREINRQIAALAAKDSTLSSILLKNVAADKTLVNRTDKGDTLTVLFEPLFHRVEIAVGFEQRVAFHRTLTVEIAGSKDYYRMEDGTVLHTNQIDSLVGAALDTLLME